MDGVLVIDKPAGPTSHDVVAAARKALREKKVGHTGTLDPAATGVLPLVLGKATKVAKYITGGRKSYDAVIALGTETTTLDAEGEITGTRPVNVGREDVQAVLGEFRGEIMQTPPMYSAKKVQGKPLYELARAGKEIEREPKRVTIDRFELIDMQDNLVTVSVTCSAGTYVRVLAKDIGDKLGCGAHLAKLRRTGAGVFTLEDALPLERVIEDPNVAQDALIPITHALRDLPRIDLPKHLARMITRGYQLVAADLHAVDVPALGAEDTVALAVDGGSIVALARMLVASQALAGLRRDERVVEMERVLHGPNDL